MACSDELSAEAHTGITVQIMIRRIIKHMVVMTLSRQI